MGTVKAVFDLDGTLADCSHRLHLIEDVRDPNDPFHMACGGDTPIIAVRQVFQALWNEGWVVWIWTCRPERTRNITTAWLEKHFTNRIPLLMRDDEDFRTDWAVKKEWLDKSDPKPDIIFEDRAQNVSMYRRQGILVADMAGCYY